MVESSKMRFLLQRRVTESTCQRLYLPTSKASCRAHLRFRLLLGVADRLVLLVERFQLRAVLEQEFLDLRGSTGRLGVRLDALHEQVGDLEPQEVVARALLFVARVLVQDEERVDVQDDEREGEDGRACHK